MAKQRSRRPGKKKKTAKTQPTRQSASALEHAELVRVLFVEDSTGEQFECEVPANMLIGQLASDFFEERGWQKRDVQGRTQRAVVELFDPNHPDRPRRLNADATLDEEGLQDGDVVRIFPESVAAPLPWNGPAERQRIVSMVLPGEEAEISKEVLRIVPDPAGWLDSPNEQLGGRSPRELIGTDEEEMVRDVLRAIRHGIFS